MIAVTPLTFPVLKRASNAGGMVREHCGRAGGEVDTKDSLDAAKEATRRGVCAERVGQDDCWDDVVDGKAGRRRARRRWSVPVADLTVDRLIVNSQSLPEPKSTVSLQASRGDEQARC